MQLDHVVIALGDLAAAAARFEADYGLASIEGGRHVGWGTQNRIVPLGETYLELIAVVDEDEAAESLFGSWVAGGADGAPLGWAVRTDDLDAVVQRLGLTVRAGSRPTPDGGLLRWRWAGVEEAVVEPALPFFIEWGAGATFPGRQAAQPGSTTITAVKLRGDPERLSSWLGGRHLPISVRPGSPAIESIVLDSPRGELVIGGA